MTTFHTQSIDLFRFDTPGIAFDTTDETWTVAATVVVSSGLADGVHSDFAGSTLINQGSIVSADESGAGVTINGNQSHVANRAGATIIGGETGVDVDADMVAIDNQASIAGLAAYGIELDLGSLHTTVTNRGSLSGGIAGIADFADAGTAMIANLGLITSAVGGISIVGGAHATTVIENAAGATIRGGEAAIFVDAGNLQLDNHGTLDGGIALGSGAGPAIIHDHGRIFGDVALGAAADMFDGTGGGTALVFGGGGNDRLVGGSHGDFLFGEDGNDRLNGGGGNDLIDGGPGRDTLAGGPGRDQFVFDADLDPSRNVGRITDFTPHVDQIVLLDTVFAHLGPVGVLASGRFHPGAAAADGSDRIIYNPQTGFLLYDPDGRGGAPAVHFATLAPHLALHGSDFLVTHLIAI